nr:MAG TPA: hypothetical protein [Bacteriophage sp.]
MPAKILYRFLHYIIFLKRFNNTGSLDIYFTIYLQRYMFSSLYPIPIDNSLV